MRQTMSAYQRAAMRTSPRDGHDKMDNGALGLMGETGELVDVYKKWMYQSGPNAALPAKRIIDELGDVIWYMAELADGMDCMLLDICKEDFDAIDRKVKRRPARKASLRSMIVSLAGRAYEVNRAVSRSDWKAACSHIRRMMIYTAHIAHYANSTLSDAARSNIEKLQRRYPNGFDATISMGRYK